jgi:hypothetical protein
MKKSEIAFVAGLLLLPLVGIAAAWLGPWPSRATSAPSRWETAFAERSLRASLARYAVDLKNPVTVSEETILAGMKIFRTNYAGCHGEFGHLSHWGTRGFYPRVPQFADAPPSLSPPEMFFIVKNGIRYAGMGVWGWDAIRR